MKNDGFNCYRIYCSVIAHFSSKKYDITKGLLSKNKLADSWNNKRFDSDGKLFQVLADKYKPSQLLRMFCIYGYYFQENPHPSKILNDNFEFWEKSKQDFRFPVESYKMDLVKLKNYCLKNKTTIKKVIHSNRLFGLDIKLPTLVILNTLFNISDNLKADNILETKLIERRKLFLDKLTKVFYPTLVDHDWDAITKQELKRK